MRKTRSKIVSVIDIGSNAVRMRIAQTNDFTTMQELDALEFPTRLGHEVFTLGKISFDTQRELSSILDGFLKICHEYGADQIKVVATTALREADNQAYVLDRLKTQNGLTVEILEDGEETARIYAEAIRRLHTAGIRREGDTLLAHVGTGSIGIAVYSQDNIVFSQNISTGSLKIGDILGSVLEHTNKFYQPVAEYIESFFGRLTAHIDFSRIHSLILTGRETEGLIELCDGDASGGLGLVDTAKLLEVYAAMRVQSPEQIAARQNLTPEQSEQLYALLCICVKFAELAGSPDILWPDVDLMDAMLSQSLFPEARQGYDEQNLRGALCSVERMAARYQCDMTHANAVAGFASTLYEFLRKYHGLPKRRRLLLELAAMMHDAGFYVNSKNRNLSTFGLIRNSHIYGLSDRDVLLVAHIANYGDIGAPDEWREEFYDLTGKERLLVVKMAAILRLSDALDYARRQKIERIELSMQEDELWITARSNADLSLEWWAFTRSAEFFEEVFGIQPKLLTVNPMLTQ